jgi:hypothetical protein
VAPLAFQGNLLGVLGRFGRNGTALGAGNLFVSDLKNYWRD